VHQPNIHIHERTTIVAARTLADGTYEVSLNDDITVNVHHIILATGYMPNMQNVTFLDRATIVPELQTLNGSPMLNTEFQTSLPNLYVTGLAAVQDFGPFFGFTVACPVAARIIGEAVAQSK
jgi:pyruvate/2-oxoglutarate dehydrogenase complex dihydrolipoamide dehydrogenase (E3) component